MKDNSKADGRSSYASGGWFIRSAEGNRTSTRIFNDQPVKRTTKDVLADLERMRHRPK
jgi:hypothetical protein